MKLTIFPLVACTALALAAAPEGRAMSDTEAVAGRLIYRKYADAVVVVKLSMFLTVAMGERVMPPHENKVDINGTMIEPSGLTVTSLSMIDPHLVFDALRSQMGSGGMNMELKTTELKAVRLQLADGREVPAKVVWKDAAHDLALLVPESDTAARQHSFTWVNLNEAPEAAMLLGNYYHLSRLNEAMQRAPMLRPSTITGIIERPRRLFLISTDWFSDALGCPVFDSQGRVLGICLRYMVDGTIKGTVVVPAADLVEMIGQAAAQ
jgi:hypothetical protein